MTGDVADPKAAEFGTVAGRRRPPLAWARKYYIPAACRGSGHPSALNWLLAGLAPRPGAVLLDAGAGVGGSAAYAQSDRIAHLLGSGRLTSQVLILRRS
jgi:hypothetical protein